ncbi:MAG: YraN family protein [Synergistaceae bacterium]|nr:YraN family protein [Synergistaceae bacterium]
MTESQELGKFAEDTAAEYLLSIGWKVLERNHRNHYGELDIIAADTKAIPEELVIVEVRCRTIGKTQGALDSIGSRKLRALIRSSMEYVENIGWPGFWRIDVVAITLKGRNDAQDWELEHIRDITAGMNVSS